MSEAHLNGQGIDAGLSRREVIQRVTALLGGAALVGTEHLLACPIDDAMRAHAMAQGSPSFGIAAQSPDTASHSANGEQSVAFVQAAPGKPRATHTPSEQMALRSAHRM